MANAKLKATPKNFAEAASVLGKRDSIRLGNNTYLIRFVSTRGRLAYAIQLHATNIVVFHDNADVTLHTEGHRTVTTKERINQFITGRVYQRAGVWFVVGHDATGAIDWKQPKQFIEGFHIGGSTMSKPCDVMGAIIAFENGELEQHEVNELFQHLVDTGLAWTLQGSYGRTAMELISAGEIHSYNYDPTADE